MDRYLTPKQVAELLQVKASTLRVWIHRGSSIPHVKLNSVIRFPERKLEKWLEERESERKRRRFEI